MTAVIRLTRGTNHLKFLVTSGVADLDWIELLPVGDSQPAAKWGLDDKTVSFYIEGAPSHGLKESAVLPTRTLSKSFLVFPILDRRSNKP